MSRKKSSRARDTEPPSGTDSDDTRPVRRSTPRKVEAPRAARGRVRVRVLKHVAIEHLVREPGKVIELPAWLAKHHELQGNVEPVD